ncbi:MAG: PHB depolymerase family esterase [Vicinamibacteria bacterium]
MARRLLRLVAGVAIVIATAAMLRREYRTSPGVGAVARKFSYRGTERTYLLRAGSATSKTALVLMLHGMGSTGALIERRSGFDSVAEGAGVVVAYPDASGERWNDGFQNSSTDDVGFLSALADVLVAEFGIDTARVYAAGLSNGAMMVHRLGCQSDRFAAVAAVAGPMSPHAEERCSPGRPVSVIDFHGTDDRAVPYDERLTQTMRYWARRDGCLEPGEISRLPDADPADGTRVRLEDHARCRGGAEVALYTIEGGGHTWPGEAPRWTGWSGAVSRDVNASALLLQFFFAHPRISEP